MNLNIVSIDEIKIGWGLWLPKDEISRSKIDMLEFSEDDVAGYWGISKANIPHYSILSLNPKYRNRGLVRLLYKAGMQYFSLSEVYALVSSDNEESMRTHQRLGELIKTDLLGEKYTFKIISDLL